MARAKNRTGAFWEDRYYATAVEKNRFLLTFQCVTVARSQDLIPFTNMPVKANHAGQTRITGTPRQFAFFKQMADIVLDLVVG